MTSAGAAANTFTFGAGPTLDPALVVSTGPDSMGYFLQYSNPGIPVQAGTVITGNVMFQNGWISLETAPGANFSIGGSFFNNGGGPSLQYVYSAVMTLHDATGILQNAGTTSNGVGSGVTFGTDGLGPGSGGFDGFTYTVTITSVTDSSNNQVSSVLPNAEFAFTASEVGVVFNPEPAMAVPFGLGCLALVVGVRRRQNRTV